jgi:hyperosmotically inducible protein
MTTQARPLQLGIAIAAALAGLALAGCNKPDTPPEQKVSAGTELDDAVITTKVKSALMTDNLGKGGDTSVETRKGEVLLGGFVDNQAQADREVQLAKAVAGVSSVQNKSR